MTWTMLTIIAPLSLTCLRLWDRCRHCDRTMLEIAANARAVRELTPCCPCLELVQLRDRERQCPTKQEAECRALVRCLQECADLVGLLPTATPHQLVERVRELVQTDPAFPAVLERKSAANFLLVMYDWRRDGFPDSIYNTELGVELSMGDLHSGSSFIAEVSLPGEVAVQIEAAWLNHEAYPVVRMIPLPAPEQNVKPGIVPDEARRPLASDENPAWSV